MKKQNSLLGKKRLKHTSSKEQQLTRRKSSKNIKIRGPWSEKEDQLLIKWVESHGPKNWARCAETIKGRNGKQCREHWNNSLNYSIKKGKWSLEEDLFIMVFYDKLEKSWKKMIPLFKSRTENAIKNRFFSQLRKITAKYIKRDKNEYNTKFKLDILLKYYEEGVAEAKNDFLKEYPMKEEDFNSYINDIEELIKNKKKNQDFVELDEVRKKYFSNFEIKINNNTDNNDNNDNNNNDNNDNEKNNKEKITLKEIPLSKDFSFKNDEEDSKKENKNEENKDENKEEDNNEDNDNNNNKDDDGKDVSSISITDYMEDNNEKQENETKKYKYTNENTEAKKINENLKTDNFKTIKSNFNLNLPNNIPNISNITDLKNNLAKDKINFLGTNNINNLNINLGTNNYINIYNNNNNYLSNNTQSNTKDNSNLNNNINYLFNNNFTPNLDLNLNKSNQNSSTFIRKPSEIQDYRKNFPGLRNFNFKNTLINNDLGIESPYNRLNSNNLIDFSLNPYPSYNNNYFNYNIFKPMNSTNDLLTPEKPNFLNNLNANNFYRRTDSNDINNRLNKSNWPFVPFQYKRSTSFGSIMDGKIYDNNNTNCDNNK